MTFLGISIMPLSTIFSDYGTSKTPYLAIDERAPDKEKSICLSLSIMQ